MADWKGTKAIIAVYIKTEEGLAWLHEQLAYLDTDTMEEFFKAYDPATHRFLIKPAPPGD